MGGYFSYGTRTAAYWAVDNYVNESVRDFLRRRRQVQSHGTGRVGGAASAALLPEAAPTSQERKFPLCSSGYRQIFFDSRKPIGGKNRSPRYSPSFQDEGG
jgi:hypothetical protein